MDCDQLGIAMATRLKLSRAGGDVPLSVKSADVLNCRIVVMMCNAFLSAPRKS